MTDNVNNNPTLETEPQAEAPQNNPFDAFFQHQRRALEETGKALDTLLPPGFKEHSTEAAREFVKGFKVLADAAITEMEKAAREIEKSQQKPVSDDQNPPSTTGRTKVKVQVE